MKEQFVVTKVIVDVNTFVTNVDSHVFHLISPNGSEEPPMFDTYKEAEDWIKKNGEKYRWYQIQKFLMRI